MTKIEQFAVESGLAYQWKDGRYWIDAGFVDADLERFAELVRQDEREAIEKIVKRLRPEIVGTPNDPDSHQQWCDSAAAFSRFESVIAAIRARSKHD